MTEFCRRHECNPLSCETECEHGRASKEEENPRLDERRSDVNPGIRTRMNIHRRRRMKSFRFSSTSIMVNRSTVGVVPFGIITLINIVFRATSHQSPTLGAHGYKFEGKCWALLHTRAKSRDHKIVRAQKKVSKGRPKTPPNSCTVVTDPQV